MGWKGIVALTVLVVAVMFLVWRNDTANHKRADKIRKALITCGATPEPQRTFYD